jgi:DinB superfamily
VFGRTVGGMDIDWTRELVDQLEFQWGKVLRPRIDSLTDEQYLWEPVAGCWSIRPRGEATTRHAAGAGGTVMDFVVRPPDPPPFTTIAWRMAHIAVGVFGARASNHFGDGSVDEASTDWPLTAAGGLELLDQHHDAWVDGVSALDAEALARPCGPAEGPYAEYPMATLVLHINREAVHHGAEIALMLDLFANRSTLCR